MTRILCILCILSISQCKDDQRSEHSERKPQPTKMADQFLATVQRADRKRSQTQQTLAHKPVQDCGLCHYWNAGWNYLLPNSTDRGISQVHGGSGR